ncbi:hypothetical protein ABB37_05261 [Leptomonas pyrrhocoris]|uniref:Kinesin n=1 Tax=Leptomonas pyrrhocoris TaxID=157538 RepID=A0A0N0DUT9_LEPPY|nr:hypothetical protein ABB37_05261 [Leptomonas pyrrhocoris]XP_015657857.1 hypothetical protein ABB37_05261 [Leptomonas pyrrhocoris]KPA79417.1 hypothetical protein ABB37_05261 [Leptomonas pyrrhocoris]KPA79418.1 hypothetical protein ABB37_05261 [Leptomonas pyrrhocoris]|eukprot:XP_015657856.1 hypothetical protein ABB37_05261 [Leptomonas pyrrhocoris]
MLVCVREVDKAELARRHRSDIPTPHFERYYHLYPNETSVTLVDVVDNRARKTFNYDVGIHSSRELQEQVVEPLLMTVLTPDRAAQAVVVVDGLAGSRFSTLIDAVDGVLGNTARIAAAHPDVASLSFSAVTLEDNNTLTDTLLPDRSRDAEEVTVLEDTQEQFTSVEDAHYVSLESASIWEAVRQRVSNAFTAYKHQIFSFIFSFHASTGRPNTTMQFISFTVNEVARGMKSSRHAVSSAAGLIECSSPTLTFTSTKLLYLMKPSLLGQQPGAWVACFSPISVVEAAERETFQEAFAVAQTASRLYSSRIALLNASTALLPPHPPLPTSASSVRSAPVAVEDVAESTDHGGDASLFTPDAPSRPAVRKATRGAQTDPADSPDDDTADAPDVRPSAAHLVQTPAGAPTAPSEIGTPMPPAPASSQPALPSPPQRHATGATVAVQTDAAPSQPSFASSPLPGYQRESIQRGLSEEPSAVRYEFDTYRTVMERAMTKLRADMRHSAEQLAEAKEEMRAQRKQTRELRGELELASESRHAMVLENSELRQELAHRQQLHKQKLQELSQVSSSVPASPSPSPSGQLTKHEEADATRALQDEVELLEVRVAELTELVAFHQSEIKEHVAKESLYRQRILDLETALREKEREVISSRAAAQEARRAADAVAVAHATSKATPADAVAAASHSRTSSTVLREDMRDVEDRAAEVELHLRSALDELQRERTRRLQLENLMKKREEEEVAYTAAQQAETAVRTLRQTFENQLRALRTEMTGFRAELAQQQRARPSSPAQVALPSQAQPTSPAAVTLSVSNDSSMQTSTLASRTGLTERSAQQQQPPHRPPTPQRMSPMPEDAVRSHSRGGNDAASVPSQRSSAKPSPSKQHRRTQSFEEYMQEEPHYELQRASFLRPRLRPSK